MKAHAKTKPAQPAQDIGEAVEYIDGAILDIVDSWSMRGGRPDGNCLMSALASLRAARDALAPREGKMANRGAS
jgi:hypothetical protein